MKANIIKRMMIAALTVSLALTPSMGVFASGETGDISQDAESGSNTGTNGSSGSHSSEKESGSKKKQEAVLDFINRNLGADAGGSGTAAVSSLAEIPHTSSVAGVTTTISGVYLANVVNGAAITTGIDGISPLAIWHDYGITGYARASSQQAPVVSYYLLKEAFRTQSPKVVVYEASFLINTQTSETNDYDVRESKLREALDFMKTGPEKIALAGEIAKHSNLSYASLLMPAYRYHDRWADLGEGDFKQLGAAHYAYKGQYPALTISSYEIRENYMTDGSCDEPAILDATTAYYVEKMQELCREHEAELILVHMPNTIWDDNRYRIVSEYARSHGLAFLDYCTDDLRFEIRFNSETDSWDGGAHLNIIGAEKVSKHFGRYLQERFLIEDKQEQELYAGWNADYDRYRLEKMAKEIVKETNLSDFLDLINQPNYLVLVAGKSDTALYFTDEIYEKMQRLGFQENLAKSYYCSYIGAAQGGKCIYEKKDVNEAVSKKFFCHGH